jgi:hypothetical protein
MTKSLFEVESSRGKKATIALKRVQRPRQKFLQHRQLLLAGCRFIEIRFAEFGFIETT